jgi:MoxR-like ATPase
MLESPYRQGPGGTDEAVPDRAPLRRQVAVVREQYERVLDAVEHVILGKRAVIARVLYALAARGHVLVIDVPGTGKTQMCKAICTAVAARFGRVQCTPDLLPADITGATIYDVRTGELVFRQGPVFTHLLLVDEVNRATPKTQSALLEVMEERAVTIDGVTRRLEEPFQVLATMNPLDHQGTFALPAAQVDRFMFSLEIGLPTPDEEVRILERHLSGSPLAGLQAVLSREDLLAWCQLVPLIHVSGSIKRTVVDYANALRRDGTALGLATGASGTVSPRATLAWVRAAQARALFSGRDFVVLEDILDVAADVLRHRVGMDRQALDERLRSIPIAEANGR